MQIKYATEQLHYPVWGMSPSSTADDTGGYSTYGVEGLALPGRPAAVAVHDAARREDTVTPHASFLALEVLPQQAYANIAGAAHALPGRLQPRRRLLRRGQPDDRRGRAPRLVLDQSMIMAALDNALNHNALQRYFAADPVSWAAHTYLSMETMSIQ